MFKELKFVQGAVAKKDFVPAMKHFAIENGTVRAYNGLIALCSPIDFDIDCKPKAIPLIKAIQNCQETIQLSMSAAGRLCVRSGPYKAFIECDQSEVDPHVVPEGEIVELDGEAFLVALKAIEPFIGDDANRQWTNGVLFNGQSLFATNNVSLVQYWVGKKFPHVVNVPRQAIEELLRIGEPFTHIQLDKNSISFHYSDGRWIRSGLFETQWPPLEDILNIQGNLREIDQNLFVGLEKIKSAADKQGRVYFGENKISTHEDENEGSTYILDDHNYQGVYSIEMLQLLEGVVTHIDWSLYPEACPFRGKNLRGALIGRKQ